MFVQVTSGMDYIDIEYVLNVQNSVYVQLQEVDTFEENTVITGDQFDSTLRCEIFAIECTVKNEVE